MKVVSHFALWALGLRKAETQTTQMERDCLARHAAARKRLAEIGVWHGVTTCRLRAVMARDASIFAIDPFPSGRLGFSIQSVIAHREVSKVHNGQVVWMRQKGAQTAGTLRGTEPFDFVFIDGDHSYEGLAEDWTAWSPLCGEGGIIALHDSRSTSYRPLDGAGSVRYTRDVILRDRRFELLEEVDSLTVMRRVRD